AKEGTSGTIDLYKSTDGGEHWSLAAHHPGNPGSSPNAVRDPRPLARIGGGDLPSIAVDPKNANVVYSGSTVFWRTEDGGVTWSAVRGAPGGDDYQNIWINPNDTNILFVVADQGAIVSGNRGASWSNWYNQLTAAMYHVSTDNAFPYRVCGAAGFRLGLRRQPLDGRPHHLPRLASGQHPGIRHRRARPEGPGPRVRQRAQQRVAVQPQDRPDHPGRPGRGGARHGVQPQRAHHADPVVAGGRQHAVLHLQRGVEVHGPGA